MNKCIQKILLAACIVVMPVTTHAGLIDHGTGYTRDSESNVVQGGGLEWLKWDETLGLSIDAALGAYAPQGWRLATNVEMAGLFNSFDFGFTFTAQEDDGQAVGLSWDSRATGPHTDFVDLFGRTGQKTCSAVSRYVYFSCDYTRALFGSDLDEDGLYKLAAVTDPFLPRFMRGDVLNGGGGADLTADLFTIDRVLLDNRNYRQSTGVALVKAMSVPEPGTFALLSLGLLGLGLKRRIHRKTL